MYVVLAGSVGIVVSKRSGAVSRSLPRGSFFGESPLFGRPKSSVKLVAESSCLLHELSLAVFASILSSESGVAIRFCHMLAER
jgi:CRP-like cAMP-binding protein